MNIYLGSLYPDCLLEELVKRKQYVDFPGQTFQESLLNGLTEHIKNLRIITSPVIRSPRKDVKDLTGKQCFSYSGTGGKKDIYVGTTVLPGIQLVAEFIKVYRCLKSQLKISDNNTLIVYALHSPFLLAAALFRKKLKCSCVVVPDLPEYMAAGGGFIREAGKKMDRRLINFCVKRLDCFVLLSPYMRERLPIANKPWTLLEGIYNQVDDVQGIVDKSAKTILYSGNLSSRTGIIELLQAFQQIDDPDYRLWIRGNGETKRMVIDAQKQDSRIVYYDPMPLEELRRLQRKATVLINPTKGSMEFTKYFFPSKTMEYLASGTPTIMYQLPCLPNDYYPHVFFIEEETIESMKEKIVEVCEMPQQKLNEFGKEAAEFIIKQKNAFVQSQKVIDLISQYL